MNRSLAVHRCRSCGVARRVVVVIYDELRVIDRSVGLAGAYCAKLLTDLGADVVRVEPDGGDPMRNDGVEGLHFAYLRASQRSVSATSGAAWSEHADIELRNDPHGSNALVTVTISAVGFGGPDDALNFLGLTEEVLQARSGALLGHGHMSEPPLTVAGQLGEYVAGTFAALGAATAFRRASRTGVAEHIDVSTLEAMQLTMLTMPTLFANFPNGAKHGFRFVMIPGNEPCGDGNFVGITTNTQAQWKALATVMQREDLLADEALFTMFGRFMNADLVNDALQSWSGAHTASEIESLCEQHRVPVALVGNGKLVLEFEHLRQRGVWINQPGTDVVRPRAPFRFSGVQDRTLEAAPIAGAHDTDQPWTPPPSRHASEGGPSGVPSATLPLAGVKVLDFTAFWAGPSATSWLAAMGADIIKIEAIQRPDGMRMAGAVVSDAGPIHELSPLFHAMNLNKRGITLDCSRPGGVAIAKRIAQWADIVVENFTPRVMEDFGLTYDALRGDRTDLIMLRLPAFGLSGPWRDRPGFAQTMEQLTGMAWVTGYEGGPPIIAGGVVDPMVGAHASLAMVAALAHRDATGEGQLIEVPMVEVALATTAKQALRYQLTGEVGGRRGAHGVYACAGDNAWVAIDEANDPMSTDDRTAWCASHEAADAESELLAAGIPALRAIVGFEAVDDRQMQARGYFEPMLHPMVGEQLWPGLPIVFSAGPDRVWTDLAPTLGQHNREVLIGRFGMSEAEFATLEADGIVGTVPIS